MGLLLSCPKPSTYNVKSRSTRQSQGINSKLISHSGKLWGVCYYYFFSQKVNFVIMICIGIIIRIALPFCNASFFIHFSELRNQGPWDKLGALMNFAICTLINISMSSYQYRKSPFVDKMVARSIYFHNGISNTSYKAYCIESTCRVTFCYDHNNVTIFSLPYEAMQITLIERFMAPTWSPLGANRTQVDPLDPLCWPLELFGTARSIVY